MRARQGVRGPAHPMGRTAQEPQAGGRDRPVAEAQGGNAMSKGERKTSDCPICRAPVCKDEIDMTPREVERHYQQRDLEAALEAEHGRGRRDAIRDGKRNDAYAKETTP